MNENALIHVSCQKCEKSLRIKASLAGRHIRCPGCDHRVVVPHSGNQQEDTVAHRTKMSKRKKQTSSRFRKVLLSVGLFTLSLAALGAAYWGIHNHIRLNSLSSQLAEQEKTATQLRTKNKELQQLLATSFDNKVNLRGEVHDLKKRTYEAEGSVSRLEQKLKVASDTANIWKKRTEDATVSVSGLEEKLKEALAKAPGKEAREMLAAAQQQAKQAQSELERIKQLLPKPTVEIIRVEPAKPM